MKTYLDEFLYHYGNGVQEQLKNGNPKTIKTLEQALTRFKKPYTLADYGKAGIRVAINTIMGKSFDEIMRNGHSALEAMLVQMVFEAMEYPAETLAIKVTKELVADFIGAKAPKVDAAEYGLDDYQQIYIEMPYRAVEVFDGLYLRCICYQGGSTFCVLNTASQSKKDIWAIKFNNRYEQYYYNVPESYLDEIDDVLETVKENVFNLAKLICLYRKTNPETEQLPVITEKMLTGKKAKSKIKTHTLFSVTKIHPPKYRYRGEASGKWTLSHAFHVRGHFRWQVWGQGRALRKLIWIDGFTKGKGEIRPTLEVL